MRSQLVRVAALAGALAGCGTTVAPDPGLEGVALTKLAPATIIPGTKLVITGASFVDTEWGAATLHLVGSAGGNSLDVRWPATFVDFGTMTIAIDGSKLDAIGGDFHGTATVEVVATSDSATYASAPLTVDLSFRETLTPAPTSIQSSGVIFVNDQIKVTGDGFLLGGDEGVTTAKLTGCFTLDSGGGCTPVPDIALAFVPDDPLSRTSGSFAFSPKVAGIQPGSFTGQVTIVNTQVGKPPQAAAPVDASYDLITSQIFSVDPGSASLGQYVFVKGGGFVGGDAGALTELQLAGTFAKNGGAAAPVSMTLIPEFVDGQLVRYVLNTDDELGQSLDLRADTGQFTGTITPIISYGSDQVTGVATPASFAIAPVRQVVYLNFETSYTEGLRDFGLRAVDSQIRDQILVACRDAYKGVNMDFRVDPPTDFALFENVDLVGVDPNNMGLFGYDNSPGKDNGNLRLYDQLGGVNAETQQDGFPGFGGIFVRSLMAFSKHPGSFAVEVDGSDPVFDQIFDPFRADQGGTPITASDLGTAVHVLADGTTCPAHDRAGQMACAVYVMGNLIGGTLAHEIGHSLGLANPYMDGFHNAGDGVNRLMDAGGDRSFLERAVLAGQGPGVFCDDEYTYLRMILPSQDPPNNVVRPGCF